MFLHVFRMEHNGRWETFVFRNERSAGGLYGSKRVHKNERKVGREVFPVRFVLFKYVETYILQTELSREIRRILK